MILYDVVIPLANTKHFVYFGPPGLVKGQLVHIPFKTEDFVGFIYGESSFEIDAHKVKNIIEILPYKLHESFLSFIKKTSDYYVSDLGNIFKLVLPNEEFLLKNSNYKKQDDNFEAKTVTLNSEQQECFENILQVIHKHVSTILIEGVTGSGKTEVYFALIEKYLTLGKQILVLLPEIALTSQIIDRIKNRFGMNPTEWHSEATKSYKKMAYKQIISGEAKLVVGARSSLYLPFNNLGLIVLDEEHDTSYKQDEGITYHARDMAVLRGFYEKFPVILSSATPSLETLYNVQTGKYHRFEIKNRYGGAHMPNIKIIDLRQKSKYGKWFSKDLVEKLRLTFDDEKQSLLFINRRGYANFLICSACGAKKYCKHCHITLTYHQSLRKLLCHHCGYERKFINECDECDEHEPLIPCGIGVEKVMDEIKKLIPQAKISIMSRDTVKTRESTEELIKRITNHEIDIVIGTQMIAKGHHFPKLNFVGIIDGDAGIDSSDLRSIEHMYQLLHQVSGRAGREKELEGEVYIQSFQPENFVLEALKDDKTDDLLEFELKQRKDFAMPPFYRLASIIIKGKNELKTKILSENIAGHLAHIEEVDILGPVPAILYKINNYFRFRILLKTNRKYNISSYIATNMSNFKIPSFASVKIDIDPYNFY